MYNILLTGGLGFIGSHVCVELLLHGYSNITIVDDLSNSSELVLDQIQKITYQRPKFYKLDIRDEELDSIFKDHQINVVIHLAGLKSVNESISNPIKYYDTNTGGTLNLIKCMANNNCYNLIFSSSATVYGNESSPLTELSKIGNGITNPYGETKYMIEKILMSLSQSDPKWKIVSLRYFNPVGAHESGLIGESPNGIPNNLMPYIMRVACKNNTDNELNCLYNEIRIFGNDYDTPDGTCIRDFIHVVDLARAHVAALCYISNINNYEYKFFNIGTGIGVSVLELVETFSKVNNVTVPYKIVGRRDGDLPVVYCDNKRAIDELGWKPEKTITDICQDAWRFQLMNMN